MSINKDYYCPACGNHGFEPYQIKAFKCNQCGFLYYHNVAATSSAIITVDNDMLLVTRARDPEKGKLDLPGGFVEAFETAEQAMIREVKEELGIHLNQQGRYICSATNRYLYADIMYNTLDTFFHIPLEKKPSITVADDVAGYEWIEQHSVPFDDIAFNSIKQAIMSYHDVIK